MDKLSFVPQNRETLTYVGKSIEPGTKETILSWRGLFRKFAKEITVVLLNFHKRRWQRNAALSETSHAGGSGKSGFSKPEAPKPINISKSIIEAVLLGLHGFEQRHGYLDPEVSLISLSVELGTNSSYLSKIINHSKQKSFKNYLNDLRVAYAYEELQRDTSIRKYTLEAIARDFGFRSAENFSKKFDNAYGIYPSQFLRSLGTKED
ncbi:MAG: helix-turn-helix domain-containing protein [Bacteroidota bacterium]